MLFKNSRVLFLGVIGFCFLSGCARYRAQHLNQLTVRSAQKKQQSVYFASKLFDREDCKKYLDRNVLRQGYQPIQITITNNTSSVLRFTKKDISLTCVSAMQVAKKVHTSTAGRAAGYGVAGLLIWPFLIPAVVDGVGSSEANRDLDVDFGQKELVDQTINPFTTVNGLIFVPISECSPNFSIKLVNAQSGEELMLSAKNPSINIK